MLDVVDPPPRGPLTRPQALALTLLMLASAALSILLMVTLWRELLAFGLGLGGAVFLAVRCPSLPDWCHLVAGGAVGLLVGLGFIALGLI